MLKFNLYKKIVLNLGIVIFLMLMLSLLVLNFNLKKSISAKIRQDLAEARIVTDKIMEERINTLFLNVRMAAEVPYLKSIVSTADVDQETIMAGIKEIHEILFSDLLTITDSQGIVLGCIDETFKYADDISRNYHIKQALEGKESAGIFIQDDRLYQLVTAPIVLNNVVEGVVKAGFIVDNKIAQVIKSMTGCEVAFVRANKLLAFTEEDKKDFEYLLSRYANLLDSQKLKDRNHREPFLLPLSSNKYFLVSSGFVQGNDENTEVKVICILQKSLYEAMGFYYKNIQFVLISIGIMVMLLSFFLSSVFAHKISDPILALANTAGDIAKGNFAQEIKIVESGDEIETLCRSFKQMTNDLRVREEELRHANAQLAQWSRHLEQRVEQKTRELKETQVQLTQQSKMAAVGQLAAGVAHEINNPLTGVVNNLQLIKMMSEQKKDFNLEDFKELLAVVEESALRCAKIIRSLLDFSHASKGKFQEVSLNDLVEQVTTLIGHELGLQNITIRKELSSNLPKILGDPQLIQQAVFDIVSNAKWAIQKKQAKESGTIILKTCYEPEKSQLCLCISDTGVGIPQENLQKIFEPFFTTKPIGEGTGLGLSIVYSIIKQHSGTIEVESQVNQGTTFKISLPAVKAPT